MQRGKIFFNRNYPLLWYIFCSMKPTGVLKYLQQGGTGCLIIISEAGCNIYDIIMAVITF